MGVGDSPQPDLSARLAHLSPERRALLERKLRAIAGEQAAERADASTTPDSSTASTQIPRRDESKPALLSHAQEFLWLLERSHPGLSAYNVPRAFRIRGALDIATLAAALTDVVEQHPVLRTRVDASDTDATQRIAPTEPVVIEQVTANDVDDVRARLREHARRSFDLERDQLLRALVVQVAADEWIFQFVVHHMASDGWSRSVTLRDLGAAYAARRRGEAPRFDPLPIDYADFSAWQRNALGDERVGAELAHWRAVLKDAPAGLDLPTDRPRGGAPTFEGARISTRVSDATRDAITAVAHAHGASRFMVLLAAYAALLYRYTGQGDVLVGSPVAGRALPETHGLVGLFANTLVLRVTCDDDPTFAELIVRVRDVCLTAFDHQDLPFELLVADAQRNRASAGPFLQTLFSLHDGTPPALALDGAKVESLEVEPGWSKVDLTIGAADVPVGINLLAEFRTDLFDTTSIQRLLGHYAALLESVAADPRQVLSAISLLTGHERTALLELARGPARRCDWPCVHERVEAQAAASPVAIAVVDAQGTLTYRELDTRANRLAQHLIANGVVSGEAVGICLPRDASMVVALLATLKAGAHYVPLDPEYPLDRLSWILEDSRARVALVTSSTVARLPQGRAHCILLDEEAAEIAARADVRPATTTSADALMYVLHTSGSTGRPKGVMIPHRAVANFLASMAERPGMTSRDAIVAVTTLSFDIAGLEIWLPLIVGARVVLAERSVVVDGVALAQLIDATAATAHERGGRALLQATPATWRLLIDAGWNATEGLRMLCGGEAWSTELADALLRRGESLWNMYGPTETTIWSSVAQIMPNSPVTLGAPIDNTSLYVLDARQQLAPLGVAGELYIGGDGVALGYLNRPDLTAERFVADTFAPGSPNDVSDGAQRTMYRTGDLVRRRGDGTLEYLGRLDQQVKIRGFRIELGEIELALQAQQGVAQAVVVAHPDADGSDARLVAYVIADEGTTDLPPEVMQGHLRAVLPVHMVPTSYVRLDAFPLTANGKIDRRALPQPSASDVAVRVASAPPRTPVEMQIANIWRAILSVDAIGVDDDFFAIGGHSLLAMRVVARLARELPARITIGDLFDARTVGALAALVESRLADAQAVASDDDLAAALAELDAMSEEDAVRLLADATLEDA